MKFYRKSRSKSHSRSRSGSRSRSRSGSRSRSHSRSRPRSRQRAKSVPIPKSKAMSILKPKSKSMSRPKLRKSPIPRSLSKPNPKAICKSVYKSASILPYYFDGKEYMYLLAHEKDGNWCGAFGGRMEDRDHNNPWLNACRELGEELYDYKGIRLQKFINRVKKDAKAKRLEYAFPQKKHYAYICNWRKIAPTTSPRAIKKQFRENIEIKDVHWVRATDFWNTIGKINYSKIYGKTAKPVFLETVAFSDYPSKKIRLRPCFIESYYKIYQSKKHLLHMKT